MNFLRLALSLPSIVTLTVTLSTSVNAAPRTNEKVDTETLFGFTAGSDTEEAGTIEIGIDVEGRFGKRDGSYTAFDKMLETGYAPSDDFSASLILLTSYHRISGVTGFDDVDRFAFNGIGGEFRWRLLRRSPSSVGITLQIEPTVRLHEDVSGQPARAYEAENKLIFDTELVKNRIFAAFNVLYEAERSRERGSAEWEEESKLGFAIAGAGRFSPIGFVGAELRYLRAYEGLTLRKFVGDALYAGPTLFLQISRDTAFSAAWNVQVSGREIGNSSKLNLRDFERHQLLARLKISFEPEETKNERK
jgi:hypothetical protein